MKERLPGFIAGVILGGLVVLLLLAFIACNATVQRIDSTWSIVSQGTTMIETPCGVIVIQVRANADHSVYFWRIAIVPRVQPVPSKPEKVPPSA